MTEATRPGMLNLLENGFRDAVVVVIGGRGGIGSEVVQLCAELGARVVIGSRSTDAPADSPAEAVLSVDIGDSVSIQHFASELRERYGRIDILVNSAGSSVQIPLRQIEQLTDERIDQIMRENAQAPIIVMREMADLLRAGNDPVVVNLSSIAALTGGGSNIAYAASKAALDTTTRAMAKALAPQIRVVNVSPSALETDFAKGRGDDFIQQTIAATPLQRLASTREVAVAVLCAARLLTATTGVTIITDAGRHL